MVPIFLLGRIEVQDCKDMLGFGKVSCVDIRALSHPPKPVIVVTTGDFLEGYAENDGR